MRAETKAANFETPEKFSAASCSSGKNASL